VSALPGHVAAPGMLRPRACARARGVRGLPDPVRPRRARCPGCRRSQVLLPGAPLPRHADATAVVGAALVAKTAGSGHRRIATHRDRPLSTVRRWLRAASTPGHADRLRHQANDLTYQIDPDILNRIGPAGGALADALTSLTGRCPLSGPGSPKSRPAPGRRSASSPVAGSC
jgi:hypothetical protein